MALSIYDPASGVAGPLVGATSVPFEQQQGGGLTALFQDRNFLSLLAGIGAGLDPKGVGGALGGASQQAIAAQAAQERAAKQAAAQNAQTKMVIDALNNYGGLSPRESPGVTSLSATPEGVKMEITPQTQQQEGAVAPETAAPSPQAQATTGIRPTGTNRDKINALLPFYSALLG
jgi:hypothetical protein